MKHLSCTLAITSALIFAIGIFPAHASPPSYLGQTTWTLNITIDTIDPAMVGKSVTLTGGITKQGDNYYSFQGSILDYGSGTRPMLLSGGGAIVNGKLIMTLSTSFLVLTESSDRDTGVMNVSLDTDPGNYLNGSFSEMHFTSVNNNVPFQNGIFAGTMTRTGNAIPLNVVNLAPQLLLLQK